MQKKTLWLLMSDVERPDIHLAIPTIAWMATSIGVEFECYLECERNGVLFARTGSTVIGGWHHQQFNYLNAVFDVKYILYGDPGVFKSSVNAFEAEVIIATDDLLELYENLLKTQQVEKPREVLFTPTSIINVGVDQLEIGPYLFPEIYFRKALAIPNRLAKNVAGLIQSQGIDIVNYIYLDPDDRKRLIDVYVSAGEIDAPSDNDTYGTITLRIAERWKSSAKAIAFGDPAAILSQLPSLCREDRIAIYGEKVKLHPSQIIVNDYTEEKTEIADEVIRLANEIGNRVIVGRQTGDGDLFYWSKGGVCIQIMDPNRPAFPVVSTVPHVWARTGSSLYDLEPDDSTLERYADEGKILGTLMWHSGEMAHNEAMLNLFELADLTGIKMGIGVHAARYETCPQLWELLNISRQKGGVKGLIEPVIHSGGMGVMAEVNCPPEYLKEHCKNALDRIRKLAGDEGTPRGYYAFADTDLASLSPGKVELYQAIEDSDLEYVISSAVPGRNRVFHQSEKLTVFNQTCRSICYGSPFVRITTVEEILETRQPLSPGWFIGTLDAPVIAFNPYIWRQGSRFMKLVDWMLDERNVVNVTPRVVARYARILEKKGYLLGKEVK